MVLTSQRSEQTWQWYSALDTEMQTIFMSCCNGKIISPESTDKGSMGFRRTRLDGNKRNSPFHPGSIKRSGPNMM